MGPNGTIRATHAYLTASLRQLTQPCLCLAQACPQMISKIMRTHSIVKHFRRNENKIQENVLLICSRLLRGLSTVSTLQCRTGFDGQIKKVQLGALATTHYLISWHHNSTTAKEHVLRLNIIPNYNELYCWTLKIFSCKSVEHTSVINTLVRMKTAGVDHKLLKHKESLKDSPDVYVKKNLCF